jgi:hypothetical protein
MDTESVDKETVETRETRIRDEHQFDLCSHLCACGWTTPSRRYVREHEARIQRLAFGLLR